MAWPGHSSGLDSQCGSSGAIMLEVRRSVEGSAEFRKGVDAPFRWSKEESYRQSMKSGIPCSIVIPTGMKSLFLAVFVYDMKGDKVGSKRARV